MRLVEANEFLRFVENFVEDQDVAILVLVLSATYTFAQAVLHPADALKSTT
jgi:hypothetical protein